MKIIISEAQAAWREDFLRLKSTLFALAPSGASIHHIGSTAVQGLAAKDIIDIQISVDDLAQVDIERFVASGFRQGGHTSDHCPPGLDLATEDLAKLLFIGTEPRRAHVHVRRRGAFNQQFPLLSRDYLRAHPVSSQAYELIKKRLAGFFPDNQAAYYDIKDPVFDLIYDGATEWAKRVNWVEPEPD